MDIEMLNTMFVQSLDDPSERAKLAEETGAYVRTRIREVSFARKILMPVPVTKAECQRSVNHDQLVKIVDIEPNSMAMSINFRGAPSTEYILGDRYEIPFFGISSKEYQKNEEELLAYEMPITEIIENNSMKDLHAIEDEAFIAQVEAAIAATKKTEAVDAYNTVSGELDPLVFVRLFNKLENSEDTHGDSGATSSTALRHNFEAKRYDTDCVLMNRADYNKMLVWTAADRGTAFAENVTINGFNYSTIFGKKIIATTKGELVPPGTMYAFAAKPFIGHGYILGDVKFWVEKRKNVITWSLYEIIGYGIGNAYAMAKVTFTLL